MKPASLRVMQVDDDLERRSESDAYHALRKLAMDQNKTIADIAQGVIDTAEFFK